MGFGISEPKVQKMCVDGISLGICNNQGVDPVNIFSGYSGDRRDCKGRESGCALCYSSTKNTHATKLLQKVCNLPFSSCILTGK